MAQRVKHERALACLTEAIKYFGLTQKPELKAATFSGVDLGSLTERSFRIMLTEDVMNTTISRLKVTAWHEVTHVRNWLMGEPVYTIQPSHILDSTVVDDEFLGRIHQDIPTLSEEEGCLAFMHFKSILSDKFVYDVLSKTPIRDDVVISEMDVVQKFGRCWLDSEKCVTDAWSILEMLPLATVISQYPSRSTYIDGLKQIIDELEQEILSSCSEISEVYNGYRKRMIETGFINEREAHYRVLIDLTSPVPNFYIRGAFP